MSIQLSNTQQEFIHKTLSNTVPSAKFYLFGSRVKGTAKQYSDLDVLIVDRKPLPLTTLSTLEEIFAESDLPFKVDIVDWHLITPEFREKIQSEWVVI